MAGESSEKTVCTAAKHASINCSNLAQVAVSVMAHLDNIT